MTMKAKLAVLATCVFALLGLTGCSGGVDGTDGFEEEYGSVENAQVVCTLAAPVVTEVREENPGPVAAGVTKIYHVQVRNANSTGCAPATLTFIPDVVPEHAQHIEDLLREVQMADAQVAAAREGATYAGDADPYRAPRDADDTDADTREE